MYSLTSANTLKIKLVLLCILLFLTVTNIQMVTHFGGIRVILFLSLISLSLKDIFNGISVLSKHHIIQYYNILLAYMLISHLFVNDATSISFLYLLIGNYALFLLIFSLLLIFDANNVLYVLISICLGYLYSVISYLPAWLPISAMPIIFGPIPHYQLPAGAGLLLLPYILLMLHHANKCKSLALLLFAFVTIATVMTGARTVSIAYAVILLLYKRSIKWYSFLLVIAGAGYYYLPAIVPTQRVSTRMTQLLVSTETGTLESDKDAGFRLEHVSIAFNGFLERPVFGWGTGSWLGYRERVTGISNNRLTAHSGIMLLLIEGGLVGTILYFLLILKLVVMKRYAFTNKDYVHNLRYVVVLLAVGFIIYNIGGDAIYNRDIIIILSIGAYSKVYANRRLN